LRDEGGTNAQLLGQYAGRDEIDDALKRRKRLTRKIRTGKNVNERRTREGSKSRHQRDGLSSTRLNFRVLAAGKRRRKGGKREGKISKKRTFDPCTASRVSIPATTKESKLESSKRMTEMCVPVVSCPIAAVSLLVVRAARYAAHLIQHRSRCESEGSAQQERRQEESMVSRRVAGSS
jgi:hypothetical protein